MKTIPLINCDEVALVDNEDFDRVTGIISWSLVQRNGRILRVGAYVSLHQLVLRFQPKRGLEIDHIDGDPLNNCKTNLRIVTPSQNQANRKPTRNSTSKYKGVSYDRKRELWQAGIEKNSQARWLGFYSSEEAAARAYDHAARQLFGEFARLNFPDEEPLGIQLPFPDIDDEEEIRICPCCGQVISE